MCGIAGVVAWDDRYRVGRDTLQKMSARLAHRGPDGEGVYLNHEQEVTPARPQVGLVHRRLAILDPDPRSNQPFTDGAGRWVVFNGEIYNYRELRAELKRIKPEYEWRTDGDTEVLLAAYGVWGEGCVEKLNGMFAFAVWDDTKGALFLARDRMGQKPLYVAYVLPSGNIPEVPLQYAWLSHPPAAIAFGSELPAVCDVRWVNSVTDESFMGWYLAFGWVPSGTIYRGVRKFPQAFWGRATASDSVCRRYFWPDGPPPERPPEPNAVRPLVTDAVRKQLVADVPLGCFLSGGVDSSVVAAAMKSAVPRGQPVLTFSIGFDDPRYDETAYAARVAEHLGTRHHPFTVRPDAAADLPKLAAAFGEPFGDSSALPTHYLARETRRHVKVALSGDGGDELFGGYDRYRALALAARIHTLPRPLRAAAESRLWQALPGTHPKGRLPRLKRLLATLARPAGERYAGYLSLFSESGVGRLLGEDSTAREPYTQFAEAYMGNHHGRDDVQAALALDRATYLPDDLLAKVDRASMLHALEVRSPFMDHELVTFAAGLTTRQLIGGGPKRMLREAFAADLPGWVFKRRKMGFAVPIGDWFRDRKNAVRGMLWDSLLAAGSFASGHFRMEAVRRLLDEHDAGRVDHAQRLYALLMLELWWQTQ